MKMMKVFDCQWDNPKMPNDAKKTFFDCYDGVGNDVYVDFTVGETDDWDKGDGEYGKCSAWLIERGCTVGEEVIIQHWW